MNNFNLRSICTTVTAWMVLSLQTAGASTLVYTPINPMFGGNPGNGPNLMSIATAQNGHKAPNTPPLTPLQRFNNSLQQAILNNLASQIKNSIFGNGGATITPGTYDTASFTVNVIQNADGSLTVQTTDKITGATSTFDVATAL